MQRVHQRICVSALLAIFFFFGQIASPTSLTQGIGKKRLPKSKQLQSSIMRGDVSAVKRLLTQEYDVNARGAEGQTPLIAAMLISDANARIQMVKLLLTSKASPNSGVLSKYHNDMSFSDGQTPLMFAAMKSDVEVAKLLFKHGAKADMTNQSGETALMYCGMFPITHPNAPTPANFATLLIAHGANVNHKDNLGGTPLMSAIKKFDAELVKLLLDKGANVHTKDQQGDTPLLAILDRPEWFINKKDAGMSIVKALLAKGAGRDVKEKKEALQRASIANLHEVEALLK